MAEGEGSTFGKYFLIKRVATGGMGEIFLAKLRGPVGFEKLVCVKRILAQHVENQDFVDMFFAEARIAAQLSHANIVQIHEMGETEDAYFITMEYVHGKSLRDVLDRARTRGEQLPPQHAIEIVSRLCTGMAYAHNARDMSGQDLGIVHRDINPHNLLVSYAGEVKIIDFGIAKSEMSVHKTETGTIKGKFVYMSPEQSAAEPVDKRSDQFSVGIVLYEALTGINPFAKSNIVLSLDAIQRKDVPPITEYGPKLAPFEPILKRALAKKAEDRYPDLKDMYNDLRGLLQGGTLDVIKQSLSEYMHDLFEEQIVAEKRLIVESEHAINTQTQGKTPLPSHRSGSKKLRPGTQTSALPSAPAEDELELAPSSRLRPHFVAMLLVLVMFILVGTVLAVRLAQRNRAVSSVLMEISAPTPAVASPMVGQPSPAPPPPPPPEPPAAPEPAGPERDTESERAAPDRPRADDERRKDRIKERKKERDDPPPAKPAGPGHLQLSSVPPLQASLGGRPVGQSIKLKATSGQIVLGTGKDPKEDPFEVRLTYTVKNGVIEYTVDSEPWAIVKGRAGIGLGKTPVGPMSGEGTTVLELLHPKDARALRINLRFAP